MWAESHADLDVSRETLERLKALEALTLKWSKAINLVSAHSADDIWGRHILDSLQLNKLIPHNVSKFADLGSGGGFPALVLAACRPNANFSLLESDQRKCVFLQTASREMGLSVQVINSRIESAPPMNAEIVTARALAPLVKLLNLAERHCASVSTCFFLKGQNAEQEVLDAKKTWNFDCILHQSNTSVEGRVLEIGTFKRVR